MGPGESGDRGASVRLPAEMVYNIVQENVTLPRKRVNLLPPLL